MKCWYCIVIAASHICVCSLFAWTDVAYVNKIDNTALWCARWQFHQLAHQVCGQPYSPDIQLASESLSHADPVMISAVPPRHHLEHAMYVPPHSNMLLNLWTSRWFAIFDWNLRNWSHFWHVEKFSTFLLFLSNALSIFFIRFNVKWNGNLVK